MVVFLLSAFLAGGIAAPAPGLAQETLLIGQALPLSGPSSSWGLGSLHALELAEEEANAKGGLAIGGKKYKVDHVSYDHKVDVDNTIKILNKLVFQHKVKYVLGGAVGATCRAGQTVTAPNGVLYSFVCWGKELLGKSLPLNFRVELSPWEVSDPYLAKVKELHPNIKTFATISPNDTSGWDGAKGDIAAAEKVGIKCVAEEYYERSATDFHGVLGRILDKKPDLIDVATSPMSTGGLILKQAYEMGYRGPKIWIAGTYPPAAIKICGPEAADDLYVAVFWDYEGKHTTQELNNIVKRYREKYKEDWDYVGIGQYCFNKAIFEAMEKAGTVDPVKVADALVKYQPYNSVLGPYMFGQAEFYGGPPRQALHPIVLARYKNGQLENIATTLPPELKAKVGDWKFPK
jgi:branched-chain amino acid transport system substrate-binding protein